MTSSIEALSNLNLSETWALSSINLKLGWSMDSWIAVSIELFDSTRSSLNLALSLFIN